jgi:hypothetical protein
MDNEQEASVKIPISTPVIGHASPEITNAHSDHGSSLNISIGTTGGFGWVTHGGRSTELELVRTFAKRGDSFGLFVSLTPHERFAARLEILYMAKGASMENVYGVQGTRDVTYLGGVLLGDLNLLTSPSFRSYFLMGAELSHILNANISGNINYVIDYAIDDASALDIGVIAGAGIGWLVSSRHEITFETRIDIGLRNTINWGHGDYELLNRSLMFMLGYRFSVLH